MAGELRVQVLGPLPLTWSLNSTPSGTEICPGLRSSSQSGDFPCNSTSHFAPTWKPLCKLAKAVPLILHPSDPPLVYQSVLVIIPCYKRMKELLNQFLSLSLSHQNICNLFFFIDLKK